MNLVNPYRFAAGDTDPFYANVSLLLHCDGTNGSTSFPDNSPAPKTVTAAGNAQVTTARAKFGNGSAAFDGTGDRLDIASSSAFDLNAGPYTIEFFVWFNSRAASARMVVLEGSAQSYGIILTGTGGNDLAVNLFGGANALLATGALTGKTAQWVHIAHTSDGTTRRLFVDGILLATGTNRAVPLGNCSIGIGGNTVRFAQTNLNGNIDELRVTKGVARYTANFTPPTEPFPNS